GCALVRAGCVINGGQHAVPDPVRLELGARRPELLAPREGGGGGRTGRAGTATQRWGHDIQPRSGALAGGMARRSAVSAIARVEEYCRPSGRPIGLSMHV